MKKTLTFLILILTSSGIFYEMFANLNGASSTTGAAGEQTCSQSGCHGAGNGEGSSGGLADNSGGGFVNITGISGTYVPGNTYTITVSVHQLGAGRFGFNCEALDASYGNAGTVTATQTGTWLRSGMNGTRQGVSQGHSGTSGPTAGIGNDFFDFTFTWTAPASSVGPVTFYATGVAINQNGVNDSGDQVYSSSLTVNPTVAPTAQILLSRTTFNFPSFYALANSTGNTQQFWAAGQGLSGNLNVSVTGSQFMISTSASGPWVTSIPLTASGGVVNGTPIFVQYTGPATGTQTGTVTVSGGGATAKTIPLSGVVRTGGTAPTLSLNPTSLNFGTVAVGSGNTAPQTFTMSFTNPVASPTITCPPGYEVSTVPTYDYSSLVSPTFSGMGFNFTIYARLKNPQTPGAYNGNITVALPGVPTQSLAVSATATMPTQLVLGSTDYLSLFTSTPGTPSANQTLNVAGTGLTSTLDVTASANFEVSLSSSSGFGPSVSITPIAGNVSSTPVYVRYNKATAGLDKGTVLISSTGAVTQTVTTNGDCFGSVTSVSNLTKKESFVVYPNPGTGMVYMKSTEPFRSLFVSVADITGKIILTEKLTGNNGQINLSNHADGIYFLCVVDENGTMITNQKVIVRK